MTDPRRKLNHEHKVQLIQRLAGYDTHRAIIKWLQEEYDITISRKGVAYYDPTTYAGRRLVERWKTLFIETRNAIREGRVEVGAANKMVRVRWLDQMARDAMDQGDFKTAAKLLAQTAKEVGDDDPDRQKDQYRDISGAELDRRIEETAAGLGLVVMRKTELENLLAEARSSQRETHELQRNLAPDRGAGSPQLLSRLNNE